jgi:hypothetical protein
MAAILELKFFNSFWLKKLDTIVEVEDTTAVLENPVANPNITITVNNDEIGVGQTVTWPGITIDNPFVYKKIDDN